MILYLKAVLAGLCFGSWPLFMNKSGLSGHLSSLVLVIIMLFCIFPFAIRDIAGILNANWVMWLIASILGALGILFFNSVLAEVSSKDICVYFIIVALVQISVPAIYGVFVNGEITITKALGFAFAFVAAVLLSLK